MTDEAGDPRPDLDDEPFGSLPETPWPDDAEPLAPARARVIRRTRGGVLGAVMGGAMLGIRDAIEGKPKDEVAIVQDADGDPPGPDWLDVDLDFDDPGGSTVHIRPQ